MDALITFLRARLDEDEAAAKAVPAYLGGPWQAGTKQGYCGDDYAITAASGQDVVGPGLEGGGAWGTEARDHIARHDPARVLADVAAKHRIIDMHRDEGQGQGYRASDYGYIDHACHMCGTPDEYAVAWPCSTLKALALPFAGHPDYREEFKP